MDRAAIEMTEIRFYRANEPYGFLSNLYVCPVTLEGRTFRSAEDAYQFGKPKDPAVAEWLMAAPAPRFCAQAAHALLRYDIRPDWQEVRVERMRAVIKAKFTHNPELRQKLLETGDARLVEASPTDTFWGIGKRETGKNMLGLLLMELREQLRGEGAA
jgi:ribA/ribD-fused uncharacterized protein